MQTRIILTSLALVLVPTMLFAGEKPKLLFRAELNGNADLATAAGGQKTGEVLPTAKFVPGRDGKQALLSTGVKEAAVRLPMTGNFLPERGTIMFWFQPQQRLGNTEKNVFDPIHCDGRQGFRVRMQSIPTMANFIPVVHDAEGNAYHAGINYKYLQGGKWYHMTYTWDTAAKAVGSYTFGFPETNRAPATNDRMEAFTPGKPVEWMMVGSSHMAFADIRIYDRAMNGTEIRREMKFKPEEALAGESMTFRQVYVDVDAIRGKPLYENTFDKENSLDGWRMEGPAEALLRNGKMQLQMAGGKQTEPGTHLVYWCPEDFPDSFIAEWEFTPTEVNGLVIVFFAAKGRNGEDLFDPSLAERTANFADYIFGDVNCYHISYFRNSSFIAPRCNLRKNHGFFLVDIGPDFVPVKAGVTSKLTLIKQHDHIRFLTNGKLAIDYLDDGKTFGPVHGGGKIGFRHMGHTPPCLYDNFRVYAVKE